MPPRPSIYTSGLFCARTYLAECAHHGAKEGSIRKDALRVIRPLSLLVALVACSAPYASNASSGPHSSETAPPLAAAAYQDQLRRTCIAGDEKIKQISELHPEGTPIDSVLEVNREEFAKIERAVPPDEFKAPHEGIVTAYEHRISRLEVLSEEIHAGNKDTTALQALMDDADRFADQMSELFEAVGVEECMF